MTARTVLETYGRRGKRDYVRVVREVAAGRWVVRVLWKDPNGQRRVETYEDSRNGQREAKAFAEAKHETLHAPTQVAYTALTHRDVFEKYTTAKVDAWRGRTYQLERDRWRKFELYGGKDAPAHLTRAETLDGFKRAMMAQGHSPNQVALHIGCVKRVFRWAVERDLIPPTKVTTYRAEFSKDARLEAPQMAEYRGDERDRLLAAMDPRNARQWRAWALTTLIGWCGPRQKAARHLRWDDIDVERATVVWRPEHDKLGRGRVQPLPAPVLDALWVAYGWRIADGYDGPFVFFGAQGRTRGRPWSYQAFNQALRDAETRAGVAHVKWRAAHGFRRGIAGDVLSRTGSEKRAAEWIGDKDVRVVKRSYLLERDEELWKTAQMLQDATAPSGDEGGDE